MSQRLRNIRQKIELNRQLFEVDVGYDWPIYFPEKNLSEIRVLWDKRKVMKRLSHIPVFHRSRNF